jgi:hypothetical protein
VGLSLEMRKASGAKKLESLRRKRGAATLDDDGTAFVLLTKQIAEVENDIAAIDQARREADEESRRRRLADEPRRCAEEHKRRLAEVEGIEAERLAAVSEAEKAARATVAALQRAQSAAAKLNSTCPNTAIKEPNHSMRLSERLTAVLLPLTTSSGYFGHLSLAAGMHARLAPDHDWVRGEREQFAGMLEVLRRG